MERRFKLFRECGHAVRNIEGYNEIVASDTIPRLPRVVIVVDELSNLMETNKKEMEARILSISQKARAAGIHLVLATQRPSVDVITGTIKNNLPSRIALKLSVATDSATILGEGGAEKLLGHGDMLYRNSLMSDSVRYQGAFISDREKTNIIDYIIEHNKAYFDDDLKEFLDKSDREAQEKEQAQMPSEDSSNENYENRVLEDPLFKKALAVAVTDGQVSTSSIQRRFRIGYNRAASLVDEMASLNFLSANEGGNRGRRVLITIEQFEEEFGPIDNYR
jgi:S-DNA-T family DNA segregation ATPase FtsK/SpoIIIE